MSPQYPRVLLLGGAHRRGGRLLWKLLPVGVALRVERGMGSQSGSADAGAHQALAAVVAGFFSSGNSLIDGSGAPPAAVSLKNVAILAARSFILRISR